MWRDASRYGPGVSLLALLLAAGLAIWLLFEPGLVRSLPLPLRLPLILLGIWALGAAFAAPLRPAPGRGGWWLALSPPWGLAALALFALLLAGRALSG